jgi:hypothetical protein
MSNQEFYKVIYQDEQESLLASVGGHFNTLIEKEGHLKSASNSAFGADDYAKHKPDKDHFLMHVVALGAHPTYLPNRNGDAFPVEALKEHHHTFVKCGHFFREHNHHDPSLKIGDIAASAYNDDLDRVELLIHGHKKKASEEYEMAKDGKELAFSMSAAVKSDRCSICGNEARSPLVYCDHLTNSMGQYLPEFKKYAFAFNDRPRFFDISRVKRPADRIAYYISYKFPEDNGEMLKAASANGIVIPSYIAAQLEGVVPRETNVEVDPVILKLAAAEEWIMENVNKPRMDPDWYYFCHVLRQGTVKSATQLNQLGIRPGTLFHKLAKEAAVLPPEQLFSFLEMDSEVDTRSLHTRVKKAFAGLDLGELMPMFGASSPECAGLDPCDGDEVDDVMEEMASKFSCKMEPVKDRTIVIIIKSASSHGTVNLGGIKDSLSPEEVAYAAYQVAAFKDAVSYGFEDEDLLAKTIAASNLFRHNI